MLDQKGTTSSTITLSSAPAKGVEVKHSSPRRPIYNNGFNAGKVLTRESNSLAKKKKPSSVNASPRNHTSKENPPALDALSSKLVCCHQINTLFRSQSSFADAEVLASEFYALAACGNPSRVFKSQGKLPSDDAAPMPCFDSIVEAEHLDKHLPFLEAILDTLEESAELSYVPCEVLANLSLYAPFRKAIVVGEVAEVVIALLRAAGVRGGISNAVESNIRNSDDACGSTNCINSDIQNSNQKQVSSSKVLLAGVASDLLKDLVEADGNAKWFPHVLRERILAQLNDFAFRKSAAK